MRLLSRQDMVMVEIGRIRGTREMAVILRGYEEWEVGEGVVKDGEKSSTHGSLNGVVIH